jgi:hypothetical protein
VPHGRRAIAVSEVPPRWGLQRCLSRHGCNGMLVRTMAVHTMLHSRLRGASGGCLSLVTGYPGLHHVCAHHIWDKSYIRDSKPSNQPLANICGVVVTFPTKVARVNWLQSCSESYAFTSIWFGSALRRAGLLSAVASSCCRVMQQGQRSEAVGVIHRSLVQRLGPSAAAYSEDLPEVALQLVAAGYRDEFALRVASRTGLVQAGLFPAMVDIIIHYYQGGFHQQPACMSHAIKWHADRPPLCGPPLVHRLAGEYPTLAASSASAGMRACFHGHNMHMAVWWVCILCISHAPATELCWLLVAG